MKKTLFFMVIALITGLTMQAQPPQGRPHKMDPAKMVEHRVEKMDEALSLTAEQKEALTKIYTEEMNQMKAQMSQKNGKMPRPDMKSANSETEAKVEAVLNAEQKAKYAELKNQRFQGRPHGGPRGGHKGHHGDCNKEKCDKKADCDGKKHECKKDGDCMKKCDKKADCKEKCDKKADCMKKCEKKADCKEKCEKKADCCKEKCEKKADCDKKADCCKDKK